MKNKFAIIYIFFSTLFFFYLLSKNFIFNSKNDFVLYKYYYYLNFIFLAFSCSLFFTSDKFNKNITLILTSIIVSLYFIEATFLLNNNWKNQDIENYNKFKIINN